MRAPRLLAAGTAAASLLLSGCGLEEPSPIVSVVSGGEFVHGEATSYCFEGQDPSVEAGSEKGCTVDAAKRPELIRVQAGEQVGVDVEKALSDRAWVVVLRPQGPTDPAKQPAEQASPIQDEHYFGFTPQFDGGAPLELQVKSLASDRPGAAVTGLWRFVLAPE